MAVRELSVRYQQSELSGNGRRKTFTSMLEFLQRIHPADDEARSLIHAGALDGLEKDKEEHEHRGIAPPVDRIFPYRSAVSTGPLAAESFPGRGSVVPVSPCPARPAPG